jgi:hypothetical protein
MDEGYFDEKMGLALEAIDDAVDRLQKARALINAKKYNMPDLVVADATHDLLKSVVSSVRLTRYNYEKARWAGARTSQEFDDWLQSSPNKDLM